VGSLGDREIGFIMTILLLLRSPPNRILRSSAWESITVLDLLDFSLHRNWKMLESLETMASKINESLSNG
jgi:hypothetical protein